MWMFVCIVLVYVGPCDVPFLALHAYLIALVLCLFYVTPCINFTQSVWDPSHWACRAKTTEYVHV